MSPHFSTKLVAALLVWRRQVSLAWSMPLSPHKQNKGLTEDNSNIDSGFGVRYSTTIIISIAEVSGK